MTRLVVCVVILALVGEAHCLKRRKAYRDLNKKVNLLKSSFTREIEELKYEVLDLRTELHLEKAKSARLERDQNGTEDIIETGASNDWNDMNLMTETVQGLQKDVSELKRVKQSLENVEKGMRENERNIEQIKSLANKLSDKLTDDNRSSEATPCEQCLVLQKAFHDEKQRANQFEISVLDKLAVPSDALVALNADVATIQSELTSMTIELKNHTDSIEDVQQQLLRVSKESEELTDEVTGMQTEVESVKEEVKHNAEKLDGVSKELKKQESTLAENTQTNNHTKTRVDFLESLDSIAQGMVKKRKEMKALRDDCLHVIRNGGPRMEKLMYVGMAVKYLKRHINWEIDVKISSLFGGAHHGLILVHMLGDKGDVFYVRKPYAPKLKIVEEEFDFSMCDRLRR